MFFGLWSKVIGFISRTSGRPSGNIDRVISGLSTIGGVTKVVSEHGYTMLE